MECKECNSVLTISGAMKNITKPWDTHVKHAMPIMSSLLLHHHKITSRTSNLYIG